MAGGLIAADLQGTIYLCNQEATRIFGYAEEEIVGRSLDLLIPQKLRERHWLGYQATVRTGQSNYTEQSFSVIALRKDGEPVAVELTIVPMLDDNGFVASVMAIVHEKK